MKRCKACGENFENQFNFCPVDGTPLVEFAAVTDCVYRPTLLSDETLTRRLAREVAFRFEQLQRAWPNFKADPCNFIKNQFDELKSTVASATFRSGSDHCGGRSCLPRSECISS